MISRFASAFAVAAFCAGSGLPACAQAAAPVCGAPPVASAKARPNIFNEQQVQWLGDAMADAIESDSRPARDPSLSGHLQDIVDRLAATLPDTKIKFRVQLVDSAEINGFSIAGGRIYITRKLAAVANNDDELTAVLGHEMGHIASHQFAFDTTANMKRLLGVTSVGDRADVYARFQQLMDAAFRDKHPTDGDSDDRQDEADRIGVYVTAAAGYRPQAFAEFWDRTFFVGGKTGSGLTDFFGMTKPDQKRLRGMLKLAAALPPGCGSQTTHMTLAFSEWHRKIVANQEAAAQTVTSVSHEVALTPPLRMELSQLRFSRDGKKILAQDEGSVFVLNRDPLAFDFRMEAANAMPAEFSPDSKRVVFHTPGLHTEEWSVENKKQLTVQEVMTPDRCVQTKMSPDGRTLVCVTYDVQADQVGVSLVDVATGNIAWQKKTVFQPDYHTALMLYFFIKGDDAERTYLPASFSADGNTLVIGPGTGKIALDLRTRTQIKLSGAFANDVGGDYAFIGNDKIAGVNTFENKKSGVYSFPDGKQVQQIPLPFSSLGSVSGSDSVILVYGLDDFGVGAINLERGTMTGVKTHALDVWDGSMLSESIDGTLNLMKVGNNDPKQVQKIKLPASPLSRPNSAAISSDGRYLALSTRYQGGIWDMGTGKQVASLHGFTSAAWRENDTLYMDVPKAGKSERHITQVTTAVLAAKNMEYKIDDTVHMHYGWLMEWKPNGKKAVDLIMHNPADNAVMWTRTFPEGRATYTESYGDRDLIFNYQMKYPGVKDRIKADATLSAEAAALKNKDLERLIEVVDARSGKTVAQMVMELPVNFEGTDGLNRAGDLLYVDGVDNRTAAYSLSTGKQVRQSFGHVTAVDPDTGRVCTVNRRDEATVFDAAGKELAHLELGTPMRYTAFGGKTSSLMILTADQKVRTLDMAGAPVTVAETK